MYQNNFSLFPKRVFRVYLILNLLPDISLQFSPKFCIYLLCRLVFLLKIFHNVLVLLGVYSTKLSPQNTFTNLESFGWILILMLPLVHDTILLNPCFYTSVTNLYNLLDKIWDSNLFKWLLKTRSSLYSQLCFRRSQLLYHNVVLDMLQIFFYSLALWDSLETTPYLYSIFPIKTFVTKSIFWLVELTVMQCMLFSWSSIFNIHCNYVLHIRTCLESLSSISPSPGLILQYKAIQLGTRLLLVHVSYPVLVVFLIVGFQQFMQCYVMFKLIHLNVSTEYVVFLVLDILLSLSRFCQFFYSWSSVQLSVIKFDDRIRKGLCYRVETCKLDKYSAKSRRLLFRSYKSLQPVTLTIGPVKCHSDLLPQALSRYMGYYITGALWP